MFETTPSIESPEENFKPKPSSQNRNTGCEVKCTVPITRCILGRAILVLQVILVINSILKIQHSRIYWWTVLTGTLLGIIELAIVVFRRGGREWRWFCPSMFLYLVCAIPLLWALELDEIARLRTECEVEMQANAAVEGIILSSSNTTITTTPAPDLRTLMEQISHQVWKQTALIVIILSRWIIPKGGLTHDELSNLLFLYFAIASDIMELSIFEIFDRTKMCTVDYGIFYAILAIWSISLLQFSFPLSAKKNAKRHRRTRLDKCCGWFIETEIWSLIVTVLLQDGPFFGVRVYCLVNYELFSYEIIFFTMKNALVILLQIYRVAAVLHTRRKATRLRKQAARLSPLVESSAVPSTIGQNKAYCTLTKPEGTHGITNNGFVQDNISDATDMKDMNDSNRF